MEAAYENWSVAELADLLRRRDAEEGAGTRLRYAGQRVPWHIVRKVQPRQQRIDKKLSVGDEQAQSRNLILEGENLQALVSLYRYRGQVDLMLTDPPYNTGQDFRYNDKWDDDPNDPDMGQLVSSEDGAKHAKWLRFMAPRIHMMWEMLKPQGILAICIDHRELFRLGMLLDQRFGEDNRLGIINWMKTTPKNDAQHVSTVTEYVLIYAKSRNQATTGSVERSVKAEARFKTIDGDPLPWKQGDLTGKGATKTSVYALQSPFTGEFHYPGNRHWGNKKAQMQKWLGEWGTAYEEADIGDKKGTALALKGWKAAKTADARKKIVQKANKIAQAKLDKGTWPFLYWGTDGLQKPVRKNYKELMRAGAVPTTFWNEGEETPPLDDMGAMSWLAAASGRSRDGREELDSILGKDHAFDTVKPLRLFKKIIQIWCPPKGVVMDPFAGSGTTGHAVLDLNHEAEADRCFVLIEQGRPEKGDPYARTLTAERIKRVIAGNRVNKAVQLVRSATPLPGGFRYQRLTQRVNAEGVLALEREEMIDLLLTSHWSDGERGASHLQRMAPGERKYLFATSVRGEGFFLIWEGPAHPSVLNHSTYNLIADEAETQGLNFPFHVYARRSIYNGPGVEFYQIPNRILEKLGFNESSDSYGWTENTPEQVEDIEEHEPEDEAIAAE
jgi:adenine-specific DNA-methyltransferase